MRAIAPRQIIRYMGFFLWVQAPASPVFCRNGGAVNQVLARKISPCPCIIAEKCALIQRDTMGKRPLNLQIATNDDDRERRVTRLTELAHFLGLRGISTLLKAIADLPPEDWEALKVVLKNFFRDRG